MLAQYLALLGANYLRKSTQRNDKALDSSQVNKERTFHIYLLVGSFYIVFQKYTYDKASGSASFLICS